MNYLLLDIVVSGESFMKSYLEVFNGILKFIDIEFCVLFVLLEYSKEFVGDWGLRMYVREQFFFSWSNIYNYFIWLEEKGCLVKNEDVFYFYNLVVVLWIKGIMLNFVVNG